MGDLSKNFSRHEFACKCGCGFDTVDAVLLELCEQVREMNGGPVRVISGCRCAAHNKKEKGSPKSQHMQGRAADLFVKDPVKIYYKLIEQYNCFGVGLYKTWIHVDSRIAKARWWDKKIRSLNT